MSQRPGEASNGWLAGAGLLMAAPALYFVTANVLKYELRVASGLDVAPIHPVILVGGLMLTGILNLRPVLQVATGRSVRGRVWNLVALGISALTLATLLAYVVVENLGHS